MYRVIQQTNAFVMRALWRVGRLLQPSQFDCYPLVRMGIFSIFPNCSSLWYDQAKKKKKSTFSFFVTSAVRKINIFLALLSWVGNGGHGSCRNSVVGAQGAVSWCCTMELSGLVSDPSLAMLSDMSRGKLLQPFKPQSLHLHGGDYNCSDLKK